MKLSTPDSMPQPGGPYSGMALIAPTDSLVLLSGQVATDPDTGELVGPDDAGAQTERILANVDLTLQSIGASWADVAKITSYVVGSEHLPAFREARTRFYDEVFPDLVYPAHTLLIVAGLARPGFLVELDVVVAQSA